MADVATTPPPNPIPKAARTPVPQTGFIQKKIFGIRVLYLVLGVVIIIAVYAWRLKSTPAETAAAVDPNIDPATGEPYELVPNLATGTVIAGQVVDTSTGTAETNDSWLRKGVAFLIAHGSNPGAAQAALQNYLGGNDLTYAEGAMRDTVVREYGLPPEIGDLGKTAPKPKPKTPVPPVVTPPKPKPPIVRPPKPKPPKPTPYHRPYPGHYIKTGSRGADVVAVQRVVGTVPDGIFGPLTKAAVIRYQRSHSLQPDGIVGPLTWRKMFG